VHHYIIHGFEGSTFARDAWPSCRRYPELVTNIPHALHMPGHIWAKTGKWDEAAHAFESAAENELGYIRPTSFTDAGITATTCISLSRRTSSGPVRRCRQNRRGLLAFKENPREQADVNNYYTAYRRGWFGLMHAGVVREMG
jgi:hypothetical protein